MESFLLLEGISCIADEHSHSSEDAHPKLKFLGETSADGDA